MSYAQRQSIGASRTFAIAIVALTHASLGYAIVTGLAYTAFQSAPDGLKIFYVEEVQPSPPKPVRAPKKAAENQPPVAAPRPLARINAPSPPIATRTLEALPPATVPTAAIPPSPAQPFPSQPAVETVPPRSATGDLQSLFRSGDYPPAALERREEGTVTVELTVGAMGRVRACNVSSSSGSRTLDAVSCKILQKRALFTPARDGNGSPTTDTVSQEIRWLIH